MEYSAFRDYCKAENSDDEDANRDLQSRLYAEVYYSSNDATNKNTESNIKVEAYTVNTNLSKNASANKVSDLHGNFINSSVDKNYTNMCSGNDFTNSSTYIDDDKSYIKPICVANEIELPDTNSNKQDNSSLLCTTAFKYSNGGISNSKNDRDLTMQHNVKHAEKSNRHETHDIEDTKPEIRIENKELSMQCLNNGTTIQHSLPPNCVKHTDNNIDKNLVAARTKGNVNYVSNDIFKKYKFSQLFINKLYLEKYETLEKRLQGLETHREDNFQNKECAIIEDNRNDQQEVSNNFQKSAYHSALDTKYKVASKTDKIQKHSFGNLMTLTSETSSDSEESILEVPIPPKPQPPVINLKDSDEGSDASSIFSGIDEEHSINGKEKNHSAVAVEETVIIDQDSDSKTSDINPDNDVTITEDIMLNCTEIQRSAFSIKEIMDTSKNVYAAQYSGNDKTNYGKEKSAPESEICIAYFNEYAYDEYDRPVINLPSKTINDNSVVYERDKDESINFAEDVMISNFITSNKTTQNRKRPYENDMQPSTSVEHDEYVHGDCKRSRLDVQQAAIERTNQELEQEDIDVQRMQNNMSKDPRLWAILDEDLMPNLMKKKKYWNTNCNNCQKTGHPTYKCPEPYKPIKCHICGNEGHTESRCPQKMCLTCGKKQQTFRQTCESCRILYCDMCRAIGHNSTECPDLWRRFHHTTHITDINVPENLSEVMKPADLLYCCNCSKRGHDSSTCHEYRWSQHFPTPAFVSNYKDGPACEYQGYSKNTTDVIPLTNLKKDKLLVFPKNADTIDSKNVIYSYGKFHTNLPIGKQIIQTFASIRLTEVHIKNVVSGSICPSFLDDIMKIIHFEIKIFYDNCKGHSIRARSTADACRFILELFVFWLKLDDSEKYLKIKTDFPWKSQNLYNVLKDRRQELRNITEDPREIYKQIMELKTSVAGIQNAPSVLEKISHLQSSFIKIYYTKPKLTATASRFHEIVSILKKTKDEYIDVRLYLNTVAVYNQLFLSRTFNDNEINCYLRKYTAQENKMLAKGTKKKTKPKKEKPTFYAKFIESLRCCPPKKKVNDMKNSNSCLSQNINTRKVESPSTTSTAVEHVSATSNNTNRDNVTQNADPVSKKTLVVGNAATKATDMNRIECIELPCNKETLSSKKTKNVESNRKLNTLPNVNTLEKSIHSNVPSCESNTDHLPSVSSAQKKNSTDNIENDIEIIDIAPVRSISEKSKTGDLDSNVSKKKKIKKSKKAKLQTHNDVNVIEIDSKDVDSPMNDQANQVIRVALDFNVPYMNKAVEEIKKKLNDKTIKQEHIDTLQRLINLENEHRKYSFGCKNGEQVRDPTRFEGAQPQSKRPERAIRVFKFTANSFSGLTMYQDSLQSRKLCSNGQNLNSDHLIRLQKSYSEPEGI